jgi:hypothetical protein
MGSSAQPFVIEGGDIMQRVTLMAASVLAAAAMVAGTQAGAQQIDTNDRTFMTFSSRVELPGVTLEPGEYEFRLAESPSRNVVQVFRRDGKEPMGQWTFVQARRPRASDETVVMFRETKEGVTPAIQYWYFPAETIGKEFVYPKEQAEQIAARTGQVVQSVDGEVAPAARADAAEAGAAQEARASQDVPSTQTDDLLRNAPAPAQPTAAAGSTTGNRGITEPAERADAASDVERSEAQAARQDAAGDVERSGAQAARQDDDAARPQAQEARQDADVQQRAPARPVGTSGSGDADVARAEQQPSAQSDRADELPRTASPLPLAGLLGLLALAGAAGVRAFRRH